MKKFITILISCSFALAASAIAQQDQEQQKPKKEKAPPAKSQPANEARSATKPQQSVPRQHTQAPGREKAPQANESLPRQHAETKAPGHENVPQTGESTYKPHAATKLPGKEPGNPNAGREQLQQREKERNVTNETEKANKPPGPAPATEREHSNAAVATEANRPPNAQTNKPNGKAKKPEPQQVQQVKSEHASFHAQPKPQQVQPVTFSQNHRIEGSEHWEGHQYEAFRSYHPEWHDSGWYHSHYSNVVLIAGGYYFFNNGYWFPAWGYSPSAQYYAYDGPIYAGHHAEPPDKVIADTQALLQQMGYYKGEVDGLLGPLTREALTAYQTDNGLAVTAAIDEPTLDSLGLS
jgi:hypothetical protein